MGFNNFQILDTGFLTELLIRFIFNFVIIYLISVKIYYKVRKRSNILFALFLLNILVFFVCYLLQSVQLSIGFAFGIFAIFSILRYRTTTVPIKEMTYIFISITLAVINALTNFATGYHIMIISNFTLLFFVYIFEKKFIRDESSKIIIYEKIDLIKPSKRQDLIKDLKDRTGLDIRRIEIGRIDFMRDVARIRIYYYDDFESVDEDTIEDEE